MTPADGGVEGPIHGATRLAGGLARLALRPAADVLEFGRGAEKAARAAASDAQVTASGAAARVQAAAVDAAGRAVLATVDAMLAWPVADQHILASPLLDRVAQDLSTHEVAQRIATPLLADGGGRGAGRPGGRRYRRQPAVEAVVARVVDSPLLDEVVARMLESDDLWRLVDAIAKSE
ncbi:MAG TPA: hypothetical protein VK279_12980, partial [Solirubrobacteraceae bacterium]|nr:hypothetical protein [Solirubrobacteraceae bacterium]